MKILIFVITYKASLRVNKIMKEMPHNYLKKFNFKILISDDCSNDDTQGLISEIKKKNKNVLTNFNLKNLGYGGNIKKCMNYAYKNNYNYAAMVHGDNQYSSKYLEKMINLALETDCAAVSGSRMKKKKSALDGGMPLYKFIGNIFLTKLFNILYKTSFTDCHTGYWLYDLKKIKKKWINNFHNGFLFDLDMRLKLVEKKLPIKEVPIITRYGTERSSIHFKYAFLFVIRSFFNKLIRF